jgi:hypothetical protein
LFGVVNLNLRDIHALSLVTAAFFYQAQMELSTAEICRLRLGPR